MKIKFKILVLIILLVSALFINNNVNAMLPLSGKVIIVDIGHGGKDAGCVVDNVNEKDINLAIGKYLELELVKVGASVILTRDGDYDLSSPNAYYRKKSDFDNRINLINNSNGDMYVSIHLNYLSDSRYDGAQVFYNNEENKNIAKVMQNVLNEELNNDREIKKIPTKTYMYDKLSIPGVLIECGFLSNNEERNKLVTHEYQERIAQVIVKGIIAYY